MAVSDGRWSLESVRDSLIRQEDTIIFSLLERAKYPFSPLLYDENCSLIPGINCSFLRFFVKETEALQSKFGRFLNPEEHPFFHDDLPKSLVPPPNYPLVLHPAAASVNVNKMIWDVYIKQMLPLFASEVQDENYACIAAHDLDCLQVLSRRIHYGKLVAEIKFKDNPEVYTREIQAQDKNGLLELLTFERVEDMVKKRVEKKAMAFGQEVTVGDDDSRGKCKIDPSVMVRLFEEWVIPLTKQVQVEYLLRRLD